MDVKIHNYRYLLINLLILLSINFINCNIESERQVSCPTNSVDAITKLSYESLLIFKGDQVWNLRNGVIERPQLIANHWSGMYREFQKDFDNIIYDEIEKISLIFKGNYFWITSHSNLRPVEILPPTEVTHYFQNLEGLDAKLDASLLIIDKNNECWNQYGCLTLYLFTGHHLWSYNWFHFWHIEVRNGFPIDVNSIHSNFPKNLNAAFSDRDYVYLIRTDIYYKIPIMRFPFHVINEDLKPLPLFRDIIRCDLKVPNMIKRNEMDPEFFGLPSSVILKYSDENISANDSTLNYNSSHVNQTLKQNSTDYTSSLKVRKPEDDSTLHYDTPSVDITPKEEMTNYSNTHNDDHTLKQDFIEYTSDLKVNKAPESDSIEYHNTSNIDKNLKEESTENSNNQIGKQTPEQDLTEHSTELNKDKASENYSTEYHYNTSNIDKTPEEESTEYSNQIVNQTSEQDLIERSSDRNEEKAPENYSTKYYFDTSSIDIAPKVGMANFDIQNDDQNSEQHFTEHSSYLNEVKTTENNSAEYRYSTSSIDITPKEEVANHSNDQNNERISEQIFTEHASDLKGEPTPKNDSNEYYNTSSIDKALREEMVEHSDSQIANQTPEQDSTDYSSLEVTKTPEDDSTDYDTSSIDIAPKVGIANFDIQNDDQNSEQHFTEHTSDLNEEKTTENDSTKYHYNTSNIDKTLKGKAAEYSDSQVVNQTPEQDSTEHSSDLIEEKTPERHSPEYNTLSIDKTPKEEPTEYFDNQIVDQIPEEDSNGYGVSSSTDKKIEKEESAQRIKNIEILRREPLYLKSFLMICFISISVALSTTIIIYYYHMRSRSRNYSVLKSELANLAN